VVGESHQSTEAGAHSHYVDALRFRACLSSSLKVINMFGKSAEPPNCMVQPSFPLMKLIMAGSRGG